MNQDTSLLYIDKEDRLRVDDANPLEHVGVTLRQFTTITHLISGSSANKIVNMESYTPNYVLFANKYAFFNIKI